MDSCLQSIIMANLKLPICPGTYSTDSTENFRDVKFLNDVMQAVDEQFLEERPYFAGLCYKCFIPANRCPLHRCGGCQLVAYCCRGCQKDDWKDHKKVCKEFPVNNGKNVLYTKGSWKKHIAVLRERAASRSQAHAMSIFNNPRVCRTCKESRQELLTDCKCCCVSYCSHKCSKVDKQHKSTCADLHIISELHHYLYVDIPSLLHSLRDMHCDKFDCVSDWDDILPNELSLAYENVDLSCKVTKLCVFLEDHLVKERLSYPMSLLYALQSLPDRRLSFSGLPLEDLTTLDIHIVTSIPLYDSRIWEIFMHRLPKLEQINVVFINQGRMFKQMFRLITLSLGRCDDCAEKGRVINYSVHQMPYHMFFSSPEYTEPNVVEVYGNEHEMSSRDDDCIHKEISYRNMTHSKDTVLVLLDATKDLVIQGVKDVNAVQSVDELVQPQMNPLKGFSSNRA